MKTKLLIALLGLAGVAGAVQAATAQGDGTVSFKGNITASSCQVNGIDGPTNMNVVLGNVLASTLDAAGKTSTKVPFSFNLTNCQGTATKVAATFYTQGGQQPYVYDTNTYLPINPGTGSAGNVAIALYDGSNSDAPLSMETASKPVDINATEHNATLNFKAAYIATAKAVTAGTANGQATLLLTYSGA